MPEGRHGGYVPLGLEVWAETVVCFLSSSVVVSKLLSTSKPQVRN